LPFACVLSAERIERVFAQRDGLLNEHLIDLTKSLVWSFLGQVLRSEKAASCQAAVARRLVSCEHEGIAPPTSNTGDYCRGRARLSEAAGAFGLSPFGDRLTIADCSGRGLVPRRL